LGSGAVDEGMVCPTLRRRVGNTEPINIDLSQSGKVSGVRAHMELDSNTRVVVHFGNLDTPKWFKNVWRQAVQAIPSPYPVDLLDSIYEAVFRWLEDHYDATCVFGNNSWSVTFPNQEKYMECVLTWS